MKGLIIYIALILSIIGFLSLLSLIEDSEKDVNEIRYKNRMVIIGGIFFVILLDLIL